jgi:hypothetical protein
MTAFPGAGTALDRIGGRLALRNALEEYPETHLEVGDSPSHFHLFLVDEDGRVRTELRSVKIATSRAVQNDQLTLLREDMVALEPLVAEIRAELEEESIPELERHALDGDR